MAETTLTADTELDCSGMLCPMPVIKTAKAIKAIEVGQILKMIATDAGAPSDIQAWSRQTGHVRKAASLSSTCVAQHSGPPSLQRWGYPLATIGAFVVVVCSTIVPILAVNPPSKG